MKFLKVALQATVACASLSLAQSFPDRHYKSEYRDEMRVNQELVADVNLSAAINTINGYAVDVTSWTRRAALLNSDDILASENRTLFDLVEAAKRAAEEFSNLIHLAALGPKDTKRTKCFCDANHGGWFYPPEEKVEWAIQLAQSQTGHYHWALKSIEEFASVGYQLSEELDRMKGTAELHNAWTSPLIVLHGHNNINKMRKHFQPPVWVKSEMPSLDVVAHTISQRNLNLTLLEKAPMSFERAAASVDLARQMADLGKRTSSRHMMAYGRAAMGWCL